VGNTGVAYVPDLRGAFIAVILLTALIPSGVQSQSRQPSHQPDESEFFEGHAYAGADRVNWKDDRLVFVKRVADMTGKGSFHETTERLEPTPEAWERFWTRIDSLGVWQWKSDYNDPKRDWPDGESWALTLRRRARQMKSKGYNAVPDTYSKFRSAVYELIEDARRHSRE
jgi:hypothetical protein